VQKEEEKRRGERRKVKQKESYRRRTLPSYLKAGYCGRKSKLPYSEPASNQGPRLQ
jgi:hypothetical protein